MARSPWPRNAAPVPSHFLWTRRSLAVRCMARCHALTATPTWKARNCHTPSRSTRSTAAPAIVTRRSSTRNPCTARRLPGGMPDRNCPADLEGKELPHPVPLNKVNCGSCHSDEAQQHAKSMHGKAIARGDALAPRCVNCHGNHDIVPVKDPRSAVAPMKVPFVCGQCHREGTAVSRNREIAQDNILENYSESMHGEALLKKGVAVAPTCATCHTAHLILPHTDPDSSINRRNI